MTIAATAAMRQDDEPMPLATESLMRSAASVRRGAGHPQTLADVARSLEHIEAALGDLSAGMARMAMAIREDDRSPGGVPWRLHTLHHALSAARDLCALARSVSPSARGS